LHLDLRYSHPSDLCTFGFPKSKVGTERSCDLEEDNNVDTTQGKVDRLSRVSVYEFCYTGVRREFRTVSDGGGLRLNPIVDGGRARVVFS
jgi:hypothetical protein